MAIVSELLLRVGVFVHIHTLGRYRIGATVTCLRELSESVVAFCSDTLPLGHPEDVLDIHDPVPLIVDLELGP